ncbi:hypothetical protein [Cytobacillus oceanisediminis]|uniref:hypothetical protein n=1 Tax=Cytobacillus oceanisediminis TaxID=665099 RepID=UPI000FB1EAB0|nr:hypothetical protein [Cytobacillus oceanisediminis]MDK7667404.1 hypothetical protein [Cytobacillus oceanisediminis]
MDYKTHEFYTNNRFLHIVPEELHMTLDEVNRLSLDEVVELSAHIIGPHNWSMGRKWLELNGRHYIMQRIFQNAGLDNMTVPEMVQELIDEKGKVSDEDILQKHPLLFDYMVHYYKNVEKYFRAYKMVRKYAHWKPRRKPLVLIYSELGKRFEELVGELLNETKIPYTKYNCGVRGCEPDFILSPSHWADAKLSEHTVFNSETMQKYEPHIEKLTIIYLRKTSQLEYRRMVSPKTELVHISYYMEGLSVERRSYYEEELRDIETKTIKYLR